MWTRHAKRNMDERGFFGQGLHVVYAPEFESLLEAREKIQERIDMVYTKTPRKIRDQLEPHVFTSPYLVPRADQDPASAVGPRPSQPRINPCPPVPHPSQLEISIEHIPAAPSQISAPIPAASPVQPPAIEPPKRRRI